MAHKWYRSLVEPSGDPRGEILVGGAYPGEVFSFDYDRPGFHVKPLLEGGVIEEVNDPTKDELAAVAKRHGFADVEKLTKDELKAALAAVWEE